MNVEDLRTRRHVDPEAALLARQLARQAERWQYARHERRRILLEIGCVVAALAGILCIIVAVW